MSLDGVGVEDERGGGFARRPEEVAPEGPKQTHLELQDVSQLFTSISLRYWFLSRFILLLWSRDGETQLQKEGASMEDAS